VPGTLVRAQDGGSSAWGPQVLGTQVNVISQSLRPFHSAYEGANSLTSTGDHQISDTFGLYLGQRVTRRLEAYLDIEMARGAGVGRTVGLAGITNGDVIRQGSADLGQDPYVARAFLRYSLPFSRDMDTLARGQDQLAGPVAHRRVDIQLGKFALSDLFDVNRYANSTRLQFMNWGLFQNTAWDFAADTRGYTNGVAVAWVTPDWALRVGTFQMPKQANGNVFDGDTRLARGDDAELTLTPARIGSLRGTVVRLLGYVNHARMGSYADALTAARASGTPPDIVADDQPGRTKWGWGVNVEQPLADSGETGVFGRLGWSDGRNESFAFTEADRHASVGSQLAGRSWSRPADRVGVAIVVHGLSALHRAYLGAGGRGFLLGDGALTYGRETIGELYYRAQLGGFTQFTGDVQRIADPGFNRDRGPATVLAVRLNLRY
jgi:high affinity Mn2+ porin